MKKYITGRKVTIFIVLFIFLLPVANPILGISFNESLGNYIGADPYQYFTYQEMTALRHD